MVNNVKISVSIAKKLYRWGSNSESQMHHAKVCFGGKTWAKLKNSQNTCDKLGSEIKKRQAKPFNGSYEPLNVSACPFYLGSKIVHLTRQIDQSVSFFHALERNFSDCYMHRRCICLINQNFLLDRTAEIMKSTPKIIEKITKADIQIG